MNISKTFAPILDYFRRYISLETVSNERLILLLGTAGFLTLVSAFYGMWSLTARMEQQLVTSKNALARMQAEVAGDAWPKRLETTQALKAQIGVRLWDAETPGLAEAGFESWLRNRFSRYGGEPQQIQITRSPAVGRDGQTTPTLAGLQRMTAKVLLPFEQAVILQVLADAAEAEKMIVVDRLIVRAGLNSRVEMDISTFIRTAEARTGAKAGP